MGTEGQAPHDARGMEAINQASRDGRLNFTRPLAARAVAPDGLRAAVEGLATEFDSEVDWSSGRWDYGDNQAWESAARRLRAILAAHPAPGGGA